MRRVESMMPAAESLQRLYASHKEEEPRGSVGGTPGKAGGSGVFSKPDPLTVAPATQLQRLGDIARPPRRSGASLPGRVPGSRGNSTRVYAREGRRTTGTLLFCLA